MLKRNYITIAVCKYLNCWVKIIIIIKAIVFVAPEDKLGKQDEILHNPILKKARKLQINVFSFYLGLNC